MCETPRLAIENHDDLDVWTDFAPDFEDVERNDVCFAHAWAAPLQTVWKDMRSRTTCEPGSPCDEGVAQFSEKHTKRMRPEAVAWNFLHKLICLVQQPERFPKNGKNDTKKKTPQMLRQCQQFRKICSNNENQTF